MKKYRKKRFLVLMTIFLILAFAGCGKKDNNADAGTQTSSQTNSVIEDSVSVLPAGEDLKLEYLPAAHTDFIFAIMCEEVGMIGVFMILAAFLWLLIHGIRLAVNAKDTFNSYLMAGITLCITLQAFVNMCVATGIAPTKGLPLPFFSYGGSSVVVTLAMMGILMNLAAVESKNASKQAGRG